MTMHGERASRTGIALGLRVEPEEIVVTADERRVRQVLFNLLSNAIKFGRGKPIRVALLHRDDGGVTVDVIDEGEGIAPDDQERIFQEFVQLGKTQLTEGTGLGLPISRRLAELLRGSLTLESQLGGGSTFRLSLPPSAERGNGSRVADQDATPLPSDDRATVPSDEAERDDDVPEPHAPTRVAS